MVRPTIIVGTVGNPDLGAFAGEVEERLVAAVDLARQGPRSPGDVPAWAQAICSRRLILSAMGGWVSKRRSIRPSLSLSGFQM